ncbi:MAG: hypothetical protein AUG49_20335 [Catenulispora sp. 13_1_20CM_3_70_7]|nr:MAG: hypothetical protein AUG49_20335 [Catenulispora sp. 13_1_20CM_3_70_7]
MSRTPATAESPPKFVWSPTGPDRALRTALEDLRGGRYSTAAELLEPMRRNSDLRCHRLLLLAPVAADSGIADHWAREQPASGDAQALAARAAVIRAIRAHHAGSPSTAALIADARQTCHRIAKYFRADPVPLVALLQLAAVEPLRTRDPELAFGELDLVLDRIRRAASHSREGHFRLIAAAARRLGENQQRYVGTAAFQYAQHAPPGSPLHLLPLVAHLEHFRVNTASSYRERVMFADQEWSTATAKQEIETAYFQWFEPAMSTGDALLPDMHLLAHALYKAGMYRQAAAVFEAIGPWAWPEPWRLHSTQTHDAEHDLTWARDNCLEYAASHKRRAAAPYPAASGLHAATFKS